VFRALEINRSCYSIEKSMIWAIIRTQKEGYHFWGQAPKGVEFLRKIHRHIFWVELWIEQKHTKRDVEYISEKRKLERFLGRQHLEGGFSCEDLASIILNHWEHLYPNRKIKVFVFEDNENGTMVE